jgi:UDP:flavonoid glycosyltransferase YjiC (YdhE family)
MRITIFAAGSRGDVQPCVVLGSGLQRAGFEVLLAAPENFAGFIEEHGLPVHPLHGDVQQIMAGETGRDFMESGSANPIRSIRAVRTMLGPVAMQMAADALEACREADALISLAVFATFASSIAEVCGIPLINVEPTPMLPTGAFPAPGWPVQRNLGRLHNRLSGLAMLQVIWLWYRPYVNEFRKKHGLPLYRRASFYRILKSTPLLGAYSPEVIPHPPDWPEGARLTGYWFPEAEAGWGPAPELQAFLEAGDPPVYVGFGSMAGRNPEHFARMILEALAKSGQRGLLLTGWGGMQAVPAPDDVFLLDAAPHSWLFPRMAAVVHHGGAGTTAEGLRAGLPTVIVPFILDQPFWGKRVRALGVGPEPIPRKNLTAESLAHAIDAAVTQPEIRQRAARLGEAIRAEDGVGRAVNIVKQILGA